MSTFQELVNDAGQTWTVEQDESAHLPHIGGFLMTYGEQSCIMLSSWLTAEEKARGRELMLGRLVTMPIGRSDTFLWHPAD